MIAIRKEIEDPLRSIAEISQSAKHLYAIITRRENIWTEEKKIKNEEFRITFIVYNFIVDLITNLSLLWLL